MYKLLYVDLYFNKDLLVNFQEKVTILNEDGTTRVEKVFPMKYLQKASTMRLRSIEQCKNERIANIKTKCSQCIHFVPLKEGILCAFDLYENLGTEYGCYAFWDKDEYQRTHKRSPLRKEVKIEDVENERI